MLCHVLSTNIWCNSPLNFCSTALNGSTGPLGHCPESLGWVYSISQRILAGNVPGSIICTIWISSRFNTWIEANHRKLPVCNGCSMDAQLSWFSFTTRLFWFGLYIVLEWQQLFYDTVLLWVAWIGCCYIYCARNKCVKQSTLLLDFSFFFGGGGGGAKYQQFRSPPSVIGHQWQCAIVIFNWKENLYILA